MKRPPTQKDAAERLRKVPEAAHWLNISATSGSATDTTEPESSEKRATVSVNAVPKGEPFPVEVLPDEVRAMVSEVCASVVAPPEMVAPFALGVLSAATGLRASVQAKRDYVKYPILWVGVVADSGTAKSPVLTALARPLHALDAEAHQRYLDEMKVYEAELRAWEEDKREAPRR